MTAAEFLLGGLVLLPLLSAAASAVVPDRARRVLGTLTALAAVGFAAAVAVQLTAGEVVELSLDRKSVV